MKAWNDINTGLIEKEASNCNPLGRKFSVKSNNLNPHNSCKILPNLLKPKGLLEKHDQ